MASEVGHNKGTGSQVWSTPWDFYGRVVLEFNPTIDVCASMNNTKCDDYITESMDSLKQDWFPIGHRVAWCNPGFANMRPWIKKAIEEVHKNPGCTALVLGPLSNAQWSINAERQAAEARKCYPRIQFDTPPGMKNQKRNMYDNVLFVFRAMPIDWPRATIWSWNWKV